MYGDQDLLNLIIGRRDIDVRYLHPRFNVQLAYPARQKDAFMDPPWCGYGQAQFVAAAAGGALNSSSFGTSYGRANRGRRRSTASCAASTET